MSSAIVALAVALVAGAAPARRLDPGAPLGRWIGESILVGIGISTFVLLVFAVGGVRWSLTPVLLTTIVTGAAFIRRTTLRFERPHVLDALTLIVIAGYARFATAAAPWEVDFIDNWGLKGRVFAVRGGLDWQFLENGWYWWNHQDYPPLLPFSFDFLALFAGRWDDRWIGIVFTAFAVAAILIARSLLEDELQSRFAAAFGGLVLAFFFATPWIGIGEGPLVAYATCGVLLVRRRLFCAGAVLLGLGAMSKNEGLAFIASTAIAMACDRDLRRDVLRLWPAVAIPTPWLILRAIHQLPTDLATGPVLERIVAHLRDGGAYARLLLTYAGGQPLFWIGVLLSVGIAFRQWISRERLILVVVFVQVFFYLAAYLVTPLDLAFHIRWSWDRLVWHIEPLLAFAAVATSLHLILRGKPITPHEEQAGGA
jgi:hypothetical protein